MRSFCCEINGEVSRGHHRPKIKKRHISSKMSHISESVTRRRPQKKKTLDSPNFAHSPTWCENLPNFNRLSYKGQWRLRKRFLAKYFFVNNFCANKDNNKIWASSCSFRRDVQKYMHVDLKRLISKFDLRLRSCDVARWWANYTMLHI